MTVMQKRLLDIIYSMLKELYECRDNWKIIIILNEYSKKYYPEKYFKKLAF